MPVTTRVAPVEVKPAPSLSTYNPTSLLKQVCSSLHPGGLNPVLGSSFPDAIAVQPSNQFGHKEVSTNGFVGTILDAYRQHNHVVLRPEDVWFAILIQFSFYVNKHAEKFREHFVDHAGKKKLTIKQNRMDMPAFVLEMANLLHKKIKDKGFRDWVLPNFTTTTQGDTITASIIMMGTLQKYFVYSLGITCGIPSVTLLGEEKDWQDILERLDFLSTFGEDHPELSMWQLGLKGIIAKMVETFKSPDSPDVVRFWQRAVHSHKDGYSGEKRITGWILGFCFWDERGAPFYCYVRSATNMYKKYGSEWLLQDEWLLQNEPWSYSLAWENVPSAFVYVPIHVKIGSGKDAKKFMTKAVAGSLGYTVQDSEKIFRTTRHGHGSLSVVSKKMLAKLTGSSSTRRLSVFEWIAQRLLCFKPSAQPPNSDDDKTGTTDETFEWYAIEREPTAPQLSDLSELKEPWAYESGGKRDALQPVTGWWIMKITEEQYGRDPDVPDVQYDSEVEDYDRDLAYNGRPLRDGL